MAITGNILRLTTFISFLGQEVLNVDFRRFDDGGNGNVDEEEIATEFGQAYFQANMDTIMSNQATLVRVLCENMTDGVSFGDAFPNLTGTNGTSQPAPSYTAVTIRQNRTTKITRNGSKRLGGLHEGVFDGNENLLIGGVTQPRVEAFYGAPVSLTGISGTYTVEPIIVGRTLVGSVYELDLSKINDVKSAAMSPVIKSQTSRRNNSNVV